MMQKRSRVVAGLMGAVLWGSLLAAGSALAGQLVISADGSEVYDADTDLTWQRCSVGQRWNGAKCIGVVQTFTFDDAQKTARAPWRVPNKDELATLIDKQRSGLKIDQNAFPNMNPDESWYWSRTPNGASSAWYVNFGNGNVNHYYRSYTYAVRLVRGGQ